MGSSYCEVKYFGLIPLNFFNFDACDNFSGFRETTQVVIFVIEYTFSRVFNCEFIPLVQ